MTTKQYLVLGVCLLALPIAVWAQTGQKKNPAPKPTWSTERDTLLFETAVGSFKIVPRGNLYPSGKLTMSFSGSVLISDLQAGGKVTPVGNVKREYQNEKEGKQVWFGSGQLIVEGRFKNLQWFGRNLKAKFEGNGIARLYGEFDKNLDTGFYWFQRTPADKKIRWSNYGTTVAIPKQDFSAPPVSKPVRKPATGGGSGG